MASRMLSLAGKVTAMAGGGPEIGAPVICRAMSDAMIVIGTDPCAEPCRISVTIRAFGSQESTSAPPAKRATERLPSMLHIQSPGVAGLSRQSLGAGVVTGLVGAGAGA